MTASANTLSAAEHARLDTYMIEIAVEVRGRAIPDSAGRYRFGSPGAVSVFMRTCSSTTSTAECTVLALLN